MLYLPAKILPSQLGLPPSIFKIFSTPQLGKFQRSPTLQLKLGGGTNYGTGINFQGQTQKTVGPKRGLSLLVITSNGISFYKFCTLENLITQEAYHEWVLIYISLRKIYRSNPSMSTMQTIKKKSKRGNSCPQVGYLQRCPEIPKNQKNGIESGRNRAREQLL